MIKSKNELEQRGIEIDLNGEQGNAFYLLGAAGNLSKQLKLDGQKIKAEMMTGDYENLVKVFDQYFGKFVTLYR